VPILGLASSGNGSLAAAHRRAAQVAVERIVGSELMLFDLAAPTLAGRRTSSSSRRASITSRCATPRSPR